MSGRWGGRASRLAGARDMAMDDLTKTVSEAKIRQKTRDGDWEISVDLDPAIRDRRAIEVYDHNTNKKFWVRVG